MELGGSLKAQKSLCVVLAFLGSNLVTLYLGLSWHSPLEAANLTLTDSNNIPHAMLGGDGSATLNTQVSFMVTLLNLTQAELHLTRLELSQLKQDLLASQELSKTLLAPGGYHFNTSFQENASGKAPDSAAQRFAHSARAESRELDEYTRMQTLPLGWSTGMAASEIVSPIGHACGNEANQKDLIRYMKYDPRGICPDDQGLAHTLTVHGCEPLPRRRCFARSPPHFNEPLPLPQSLWSIPSDDNILWTPYTCKSFACLNERKKKKVFEDCIDCFELQGREKQRWTKHTSDLDFSIDEVLLLKPGSIRIGLDIGGGTGTFAVRMREKNVTIVTTSLNLNGPFNNFIALRGVVPLFVTIAQRLPFFDNTLDIVHSMHVLSNWIPTNTLEFLLFDIDRVLRPGGLLWLDHFFCIQHQLDVTYMPLIEKLGYQKLRWGVGPKLDRGPDLQEVYLSAVLEKPLSRG
ncbi:hypothetical protein GOP47_0007403 [Adiantum capillus-veneris]|uniref:Methyltransferase type 11 domain-containing protein n=1 Tax=Adiantum capillus-veneris TaxID=13818 RepID=A0A9D4V0T6_ADICA|nr:hypothetical protein GOP47_0007403 [Adiantum capillus-veneris]